MEGRRLADQVHPLVAELERLGEEGCDPADPLSVLAGGVVAIFAGRREPFEDLDARLVELLGALANPGL